MKDKEIQIAIVSNDEFPVYENIEGDILFKNTRAERGCKGKSAIISNGETGVAIDLSPQFKSNELPQHAHTSLNDGGTITAAVYSE